MLDYVLHSPFNLGVKTLLVLVVLIVLEAVFSADNAIALAKISQTLHTPRQARRALNVGLGIAYVLRILLIASAALVVQFWQFELIGAVYLLWLSWQYFTTKQAEAGDCFVSP